MRIPAGIVSVSVAVALAAGLVGCSSSGDPDVGRSVVVEESGVTVLADLTADPAVIQPTAEWKVPQGSIVEVDSTRHAAVRSTTGEAHPLQEIGLLDLSSGEYSVVIPRAIGHDEGFDLCDVRATDELVAWIETRPSDDAWAVWAAPLSGSVPGAPVLLDEGDSSTVLPSMTVWGDRVCWLAVPDPDGTSDADAQLRVRALGDDAYRAIWASSSTVTGSVRSAAGTVTVVERSRVSGTRRSSLIALDIESGDVVDTLVLPAPISPSDAVFLDGAFAFSVPAKYDGVGPLGSVGTYLQTGDATFVRLPRQPLDTPALVGNWFAAKEGASVVVVDATAGSYVGLPPVSGAPDFGEYIASNIPSSRLVTFTQPVVDDGSEAYTLVRVFSF